MSRYIKAVNAIKQNITRISLTSGQAFCRIHILERIEYPGVINLYGGSGSGKTVLGWCLESEGHFTYIVEPALLHNFKGIDKVVFIDNGSHHREDYRHILDDLARERINQAIVVTRDRIDDYVQSVLLSCTESDIKIALNNLLLLGFKPPSKSETSLFRDLWDVLHAITRR
jgi:hypothetical protein